MVDKEEIRKTPSPLNINEAIEGDALNQKTARSKYEKDIMQGASVFPLTFHLIPSIQT